MTEIPPTQTMPYGGERRQLPQSTVQAAAAISGDVVSGLGRSPLMLAVVVLNVIGIIAAVYFLNLLIHGQQAHLKELLAVQQEHVKNLSDSSQKQLTQILEVHNREFDAMVEMLAYPMRPPQPTTSRGPR